MTGTPDHGPSAPSPTVEPWNADSRALTGARTAAPASGSAGPSPRPRGWQYAPRPASEEALARLVAALRGGATRVALLGPPGSGKTLLLHVLPERLGFSFAHVYLPNPGLGPGQIRAWLASIGEPLPADAGDSLEDLAYAYSRRGPGLVLLVDDADAMPAEIADDFAAVLARTEDRLRLVLAGADETRLADVLRRLGGPVERVAISRPPGPAATKAAVQALAEPTPTPLFDANALRPLDPSAPPATPARVAGTAPLAPALDTPSSSLASTARREPEPASSRSRRRWPARWPATACGSTASAPARPTRRCSPRWVAMTRSCARR